MSSVIQGSPTEAFLRFRDQDGNTLVSLNKDGSVSATGLTDENGEPFNFSFSTLEGASVFIDSATAVIFTNSTGPFLAAGSYTFYVAITDGAGNWSNLASHTFTADGSHNYAVTWNPPSSWWSLGTGTQFTNIFNTNTNVAAWVSFNGGPPQSVTSATGGTLGFIGYNYWQPFVRIGGGYVGGNTPIPTLDTLPAIKLTSGGPAPQSTGLVLHAPTMDWINISQQVNFGSPGGAGLTIVDPTTSDTAFINPFSQGGYLLFEQNGLGTGALTFNAGAVSGKVSIACGNNGSVFTGTLNLNLGTHTGTSTLDFSNNTSTRTYTFPDVAGTVMVEEALGFGNGSAGTAVTTTAKGSGTGPVNPQTVVQYAEVVLGGQTYWVPLVQ